MENNGSDMVETLVRLAFWKVRNATPFTFCKDCVYFSQEEEWCKRRGEETVAEAGCTAGKNKEDG